MIALSWWETERFAQFGAVVQAIVGILALITLAAWTVLPLYLILRLNRIQKTLDALLARDRMKDSKSQTNYDL